MTKKEKTKIKKAIEHLKKEHAASVKYLKSKKIREPGIEHISGFKAGIEYGLDALEELLK